MKLVMKMCGVEVINTKIGIVHLLEICSISWLLPLWLRQVTDFFVLRFVGWDFRRLIAPKRFVRKVEEHSLNLGLDT